MGTLIDYRGVSVRVTNERIAHILEHPEMAGMETSIAEALRNPDLVVRSLSDDAASLYYLRCRDTPVGEKYLCAVVKEGAADSFLLTAYLTDTMKKGDMVWKKR